MNILSINHYAGSLKHGMEYRPFYLAREWVKLGHRVTVAAASFSHLRVQQPCMGGNATEEMIDGVRFVWLKTPAYSGNGVRRAWNMMAFSHKLWWHRGRVRGAFAPDAVIISSPHPFAVFPARRIAAAAGAKLIFEVRDLWPLTLIELNGMSPWHPFIQWLQYTENFAYRRADVVVSTLPKAASYMQAHGMAPEKFVFIPNGINAREWGETRASLPPEHADCLQLLRSAGRFVVGYVGGHQPSNALWTVLEAAELLRNSAVTFVLVGQGSDKENLRRRAAERKIKNVVFLPPIPRACVPAILAAMDVLYLGLKNQPIFRFGISPNKLMDYMMAAKPVIHAVEAGNDLVDDAKCGISCPAETPSAVVDAVLRLMDLSPAERTTMGLRGREYVLLHHQYPILARNFLDIVAGSRSPVERR